MWEVTMGLDTFLFIIVVALLVGAVGMIILIASAVNR